MSKACENLSKLLALRVEILLAYSSYYPKHHSSLSCVYQTILLVLRAFLSTKSLYPLFVRFPLHCVIGSSKHTRERSSISHQEWYEIGEYQDY